MEMFISDLTAFFSSHRLTNSLTHDLGPLFSTEAGKRSYRKHLISEERWSLEGMVQRKGCRSCVSERRDQRGEKKGR